MIKNTYNYNLISVSLSDLLWIQIDARCPSFYLTEASKLQMLFFQMEKF